MKEIAVVSGKGGTGKSTISAAFASLAENKIMVDADVDASDLHLIFKPKDIKEGDYTSHKKAAINKDICTGCGLCRENCYFDAISPDFVVDPYLCEGCVACQLVCPVNAIEMSQGTSGKWFIAETRFGMLTHAKLNTGEENSGKLVTLIRNFAIKLSEEMNLDYVIIDGPPGIGCPVNSAVTGVAYAVAVIEPTLSGMHDFKRLIELAAQLQVKLGCVINKYDINLSMTREIEQFCAGNNIELLAKLPYTDEVIKANVAHQTIVEYAPGSYISRNIKELWNKVVERAEK